jgi:hypothetical protein
VIPTALGAQIIVRPGFGIHFIVLIAFAHSMMGMTVFFSSLFTSRRAASVIGYLLVIITSSVAPVLSLNMKTWPIYSFLFPPVAYIRSLDLAMRYGSSAFSENSDMTISIVMLIVMGTVWGAIGIYLNTIKYRSAFYIFDSCRPAKRNSYRRAISAARADGAASYGALSGDSKDAGSYQQNVFDQSDMVVSPSNGGDLGMPMMAKVGSDNNYGLTTEQLSREDIDVRQERDRIMGARWSSNQPPAIVIRNLVKSFAKSGTEKHDKVNHT